MAVMQEEKFKLYLNLLHNAIREYEQASRTIPNPNPYLTLTLTLT